MVDSDHQSTESGTLIGSNDDLLSEILLRLPVTSVLRFKSVSKHLLSLLSYRSFSLRYDNLLRSPGMFVCNPYIPFDVENQSPPPFRSLSFYLDLDDITIVQSCNGLLLCRSGHQWVAHGHKYYVFNPTTKQFIVIPPIVGGFYERNTVNFMALAFHQTNCVHYKIVCVHRRMPNVEGFIQIYSSDTGKWKITSESFPVPYQACFNYGVYWNGTIHWAPSSLTPLFFNLDEEHLQKLPLPSPLPMRLTFSRYYKEVPLYFGESRSHLHLVETADRKKRLLLNVHEMFADHSGWFLKYQVDLSELSAAYSEMLSRYEHPISSGYYKFKVFDVIRGEEEVDTFMVVAVHEKIIRYNILNKSFIHISDLPENFDLEAEHTEIHRYIETLTYF